MSVLERYRIRPGARVRLSARDADETSGFRGKKEAALEEIERLKLLLEPLQELLHARRQDAVLIVLQGMDTSGKDGTIRRVFEGVNPQGVRVASFGRPTALELSHDFLWRVHDKLPGKGEIVIFNRSHYEDVLIARIHELVPEAVWKARYQEINDFERTLATEGTTIRKFFLHIDSTEQRRRLEERLADPTKQWKFNMDDLRERKLWKQYMRAYEDALERTSTQWAPWYRVPANHKWFRDLVVSTVLVDTLRGMSMTYPDLGANLRSIRIR